MGNKGLNGDRVGRGRGLERGGASEYTRLLKGGVAIGGAWLGKGRGYGEAVGLERGRGNGRGAGLMNGAGLERGGA